MLRFRPINKRLKTIFGTMTFGNTIQWPVIVSDALNKNLFSDFGSDERFSRNELLLTFAKRARG